MNSFPTIKTFMFPAEAYVLKGRLESEGINCFLKDELQVQTNPLHSNALGGVKLQVQSDQLENALAIVESHGIQIETEETVNSLYYSLLRYANTIPGSSMLPELARVMIPFLIITGLTMTD